MKPIKLGLVFALALSVVTVGPSTPEVEAAPAPAPVVTAAAFPCCIPTYTVTRTSGSDPGKQLNYVWSAAIPLQSGFPTVCNATYLGGQASWQCRSVHGYDPLGGTHDRNYILTNFSTNSILHISEKSPWNFGQTITMWDGSFYEGCNVVIGKATCDYYSNRWTYPFPRGDNAWSLMLRKTWDWLEYAGDALGCASSLSGLIVFGKNMTAPGLLSCVPGPM